jgi:uncharacterized protein
MIENWRLAVQTAMQRAAHEENLQKYGTEQPVYDYRWEHVTTVVTLAQKLARLVGADEDVIEAAAWLHDIAKIEGEIHAASGADFARIYLAQTDFPPEKIEAVCQAIAEHQGLWRDEPLTGLESMVLWDADKLSKIGLTAAFQWTGMAMTGQDPISTAEIIENNRSIAWQEKTVASMHTEPARRAAYKRMVAYQRFWSELENELNGDDLS